MKRLLAVAEKDFSKEIRGFFENKNRSNVIDRYTM